MARFLSRTVPACVALVVASIVVLGPGQRTASAVACPETLHDGFTSASADKLKLNGTITKIEGGHLVLTTGTGQSAAAWSESAVSLLGDASFSTSFTLKFSDPIGGGADGIVFAVQTQSNSAGSLGEGIGIGGVSPSLAVEFDTFQNGSQNDPDNHHMAIDLNGSVNHGNPVNADRLFTTSANFFTQGTWYVWIEYNGVTKKLEGRISTTNSRPASAQVSIVDDLADRLKTTSAFVGFTAATGGAGGTQEVLKWRFFPCYNPNPDGTAQSITFAALAGRTVADPSTFSVSATASSGLAVSFSSATTSVCTVSGTTVTVLTTGTCSIIASQPGDSTFAAADPVTRSFAVSPIPIAQVLTFGPFRDRTMLDQPFTVRANASSGLPVSITSGTPDVCTLLPGGWVTLVSAGTCTLTATVGGSPGGYPFLPGSLSRSFAVTRVPQSIVGLSGIDLFSEHVVGEAPAPLSATATSGLPVSLAASGACAMSGGALSFTKAGDCTLTASQAGDATYLPAADLVTTFKVKILRPPAAIVAPSPAGAAPPATRQTACGPVPALGAAAFIGIPGYHSAWAGESPFLVARPGQVLEYCLILRNTGTMPWVSGTRSTQINLGANAPQDSTVYVDAGLIVSDLYDRNRFSTAQEATVVPGDYATFVVRVQAPMTPGITRLDMAPVIDGVQWLEDEGIFFLIHVR